MVVEISVLAGEKNSANDSSLGTSSLAGLTMRAGMKPPSFLRWASRYFVSGLSAGGR